MFFYLHPILITLTFLIIAIVIAITLHGSIICLKAKGKINGVLRNEDDLQIVREAVKKSKFYGHVFLISYVTYLVLIIAADYLLNRQIGGVKTCLGVNGYSILPFAIIMFFTERPLKKLRIESEDTELEEKYRMMLLDWEKFGPALK